eukprot:TRINITY_DN375_c0_g1_i1.p1 TRINITY_DN375_c0_g1~~TRINITY_DN375_c0_g1_i1.p1  ORF type:complete len:409 (-),score=77.39 TRINITY_DN375_c0_g1_i1:177-1403(-)
MSHHRMYARHSLSTLTSPSCPASPAFHSTCDSTTFSARSRSELVLHGTPVQVVSHRAWNASPKPQPYSPPPRSPQLSPQSPSPHMPSPMQLPPPPSLLSLPPSSFQQSCPSPPPSDPSHESLSSLHQQLSSDDSCSLSSSEHSSSSPPPSPNNFFIHNGYRYDGDVFELRPPQERSIGSRPQRVLEHKPLLLANRQTFNRVYSEGTYNARPSSLRQPAPRARRKQTTHLHITDGTQMNARKVTRPPSVRPPAVQVHGSSHNFAECIAAVKQNASANGDDKLKGLLAYSAVPVTRQSGTPPPAFLPSTSVMAAAAPLSMRTHERENLRPLSGLDKRGRSYTSFAAHSVYDDTQEHNSASASAVLRAPKVQHSSSARSSKFGSGGVKGGWFREKEREREKRPSFWKLLSR